MMYVPSSDMSHCSGSDQTLTTNKKCTAVMGWRTERDALTDQEPSTPVLVLAFTRSAAKLTAHAARPHSIYAT